jgi:hypothetical protein
MTCSLLRSIRLPRIFDALAITYSLDFAPSDFFLKEQLTDSDRTKREQLKAAINEFVDALHKESVTAVILSWIKRLKSVTRHTGECSHKWEDDEPNPSNIH